MPAQTANTDYKLLLVPVKSGGAAPTCLWRESQKICFMIRPQETSSDTPLGESEGGNLISTSQAERGGEERVGGCGDASDKIL